MSNWPKWKNSQDFESVQDLVCLLDSIAFLCPVHTHASDTLALNIVTEVEATVNPLTLNNARKNIEYAGLCYGVWALAAYYGDRDPQLQPRLTLACAAAILQLDHPNNTATSPCLYTSDGLVSQPSSSARQIVLPDFVVDCLDGLCRLIKRRAVHQTSYYFLLRDKDAVVKILAGM